MIFLMMLSVKLLSILIILLATLSAIRNLIKQIELASELESDL